MLPGQGCASQPPQRRRARARASRCRTPAPAVCRKRLARQRDVAAPLAQRRQVHRDQVQPVEQVLAELRRARPSRRGCGWWRRRRARPPCAAGSSRAPRRCGPAARAAASPARPASSSPISSRKMVPPSASSKRPLPVLARVGEGALHVAEHLALEQRGRDAAQVDLHERPARAARLLRWSASATSSLPVPLSPVISTEASVGADAAHELEHAQEARGPRPTRPPKS